MSETPLTTHSCEPTAQQTRASRRARLARRIGCAFIAAVFAVFIGVPIVVLAWISWDLGFLTPHASDAELIELLHDHKPEFETLLSMFEADAPLRVVHPTWLDPENAISPERWNEYRRLFSELGIDGGIRRYNGKGVWFLVDVKGLVTGGSDKGLIFRPREPIPLYDSLDDIKIEEDVRAYRKIDDDWYITSSYDS